MQGVYLATKHLYFLHPNGLKLLANMKNKIGGRPTKKRGEGKTYRASARLNTSEYYSFLAKVKQSNLSQSDFVRQCICQAEVKERFSVEHLHLIRSLSGMANNLNALTRQAYIQGFSVVFGTMKELSKDIDDIIKQMKT